jgi:hypothetical protein
LKYASEDDNVNATPTTARRLTANAKLNKNDNCAICKKAPKKAETKDVGGVRKWSQPKTCKMLLGEL